MLKTLFWLYFRAQKKLLKQCGNFFALAIDTTYSRRTLLIPGGHYLFDAAAKAIPLTRTASPPERVYLSSLGITPLIPRGHYLFQADTTYFRRRLLIGGRTLLIQAFQYNLLRGAAAETERTKIKPNCGHWGKRVYLSSAFNSC